MQLITKEQRKRMIENHRAREDRHNRPPVVKLFDPYGGSTWLLSSIEFRDGEGIAYGIGDLNLGCPELGEVSLKELEELRYCGNQRIERDKWWNPDGTLDEYHQASRAAGHIVDHIGE